jgi:hypothetical protein
MFREVGCFAEKQADIGAEHIEVANIDSSEQVLTPPSIKQPPSTGNSRPLKRTYAVAGQQQCPKHQEKTNHYP